MASRARFRLCIITDARVAPSGDIVRVCELALAGASEVAPVGAVAIQLRDREMPARERFRVASTLRKICIRFGAPLLINDRVDIALAVDADGVHLPFDSIGVTQARQLMPADAIVGFSAHSPPDVAMAARAGADYALFAPVFDPISKPAERSAWGASGLGIACRAGEIPVYALGGITSDRIDALYAAERASWPAGVAVIGAVMGSRDPAEATRSILRRIEKASGRA
jgi:thiamine-phosphate pyrophosphorylase